MLIIMILITIMIHIAYNDIYGRYRRYICIGACQISERSDKSTIQYVRAMIFQFEVCVVQYLEKWRISVYENMTQLNIPSKRQHLSKTSEILKVIGLCLYLTKGTTDTNIGNEIHVKIMKRSWLQSYILSLSHTKRPTEAPLTNMD